MKRVMQDKFGEPEGNCYAACIASILEIPLREVPNFCAEHRASDWMLHVQRWLADRGLGSITMRFKNWDAIRQAIHIGTFPKNLNYIISGESPRGLMHSCVGRSDSIVHDPHPEGGGIKVRAGLEVEVLVRV